MNGYKRMITELICYANNAEIIDYSENLAVSPDGELIDEVHVNVIVHSVVNEITINLSNEWQGH